MSREMGILDSGLLMTKTAGVVSVYLFVAEEILTGAVFGVLSLML